MYLITTIIYQLQTASKNNVAPSDDTFHFLSLPKHATRSLIRTQYSKGAFDAASNFPYFFCIVSGPIVFKLTRRFTSGEAEA